MTNEPDSLADIYGEVIHSYSRAQAIEDGVLVDVTEIAREAGFKWPFTMTAEVYALINDIPEKHKHEDVKGRLWDVLMLAWTNIRVGRTDGELLFFDVTLHHSDGDCVRLKLHCGPGDEGEPVLTLMLPDQD